MEHHIQQLDLKEPVENWSLTKQKQFALCFLQVSDFGHLVFLEYLMIRFVILYVVLWYVHLSVVNFFMFL